MLLFSLRSAGYNHRMWRLHVRWLGCWTPSLLVVSMLLLLHTIDAFGEGGWPLNQTQRTFDGSKPFDPYRYFYNHSDDREPITVGYLVADRSNDFTLNMQGRVSSGAITLGILMVNQNRSILPNHRLQFVWADNSADTLTSIGRLTHQWKNGALAFFGPEDSCNVEGRVAAAWNLPMISFKCADHRVSDKNLYPTFIRTSPTAAQVSRSVIALLNTYGWKKFTLIVGSSVDSNSIAQKITDIAEQRNMTINGRFEYTEPHQVLIGNPFISIVEKSFVTTRIYVFLGDTDGMVEMVHELDERGLLSSGEYMVIFVDQSSFTTNPIKYFQKAYECRTCLLTMNATSSVLIIVTRPGSTQQYEQFQLSVNDYLEEPPFLFPNPFQIKKQIPVYAAYLYDSVMLYAHALSEVLKENGTAKDGTAIINKIFNFSYWSIQGFRAYIDKNGDAVGNYMLLSRQLHTSEHSNYSMIPTGDFQVSKSGDLPELILRPDMSIQWVGGEVPVDEPVCGYEGKKCLKPPNYTLEIGCGVLGGIIFVTAVVVLMIYRNWRYEQEIAGLLWKISPDDIQGLSSGPGGLQATSHITLHSQMSYDSRLSQAQVFAVTATYKGQVVALKRYTKRHMDISRNMKKEMKLMKDLRHDNVNAFIGACCNQNSLTLISEYCSKGSLQDILENDDVKLDSMFLASLVADLIKGMTFLHECEMHSHGNLKSSNCVVNSRWVLQVADFGLLPLRRSAHEGDDHRVNRNKLWTAPELLRDVSPPKRGTPKGDVYSFGIILHEIIARSGPFGNCFMAPIEIIHRVCHPSDWLLRPDTKDLECQDYIKRCMQDCWEEIPEARPDFRSIRSRLKPMRQGMKNNIFDNMMAMMEKYQGHLEDLVADRTDQLMEEKKKTEGLLHRMLPKSVADQLVSGEHVKPETFQCVTIYFSDICGFTAMAAETSPLQVVDLLNDLYTLFDSIIRNYDVYKVETIGDAYMVVSGLPILNGENHAGEIASMSLHLLSAIKSFTVRHCPNQTLRLRIGIHSGPAVAGVVGLTMPRYCLFGDTVNTSSRMESNGLPLKIHVSSQCREILTRLGGYALEERGLVNMKGKGEVLTYWLESEDKSVRMKRQSCAYIGMDPGDDVYCRRTSGSSGVVHMPSVPVVTPDNNHVPLHRQSSGAEPTFLELMRETDPVPCLRHGKGVRRVPSIGLRRVPSGTAATGLKRLSFDARSMTKDIAAANGFVQRQGETDKTESNGARNALPAIVVDKTPLHLPDDNPSPSAYSPPPYPETSSSIAPSSDCMSTSGVCRGTNGECRATPSEFIASDMLPQQRENGADGHEVADETDRLLDSGLSGDESTRRACAAGIASAALDCGHNCTSASDNHKDYQEYSFTPLTNLNTSSTEMSHIICE